MNGFLKKLALLLTQWLEAWGKLLLSTMPEGVRRIFHARDAAVEINVTSQGDWANKIGQQDDLHCAVFKIDQALVLSHSFPISAAAAKEIDSVVSLEAERIMPVDASELYVTHDQSSQLGSGELRVHIAAVRKSLVNSIIFWAKEKKVEINAIELAVSGSDFAYLPLRLKDMMWRSFWRHSFIVASVVGILIFLTSLPSIYVERLQNETFAVELAVRELRSRTQEIAGLQRQVTAMEGLSASVEAIEKQGQLVDLFVQLTDASPDDIVFNEVRLDGRRLFLVGEADAPEDWVFAVQKQDAFDAVQLSSVLIANDPSRKRFEVRMDAVWPSERADQ